MPRTFRKPPKGCVLHKAVLTADEIEERSGFRVTTPLRTLLDAAAGTVSQEQLGNAVSDALTRGLVRRAKLSQAIDGDASFTRLRLALGGRKVGAK